MNNVNRRPFVGLARRTARRGFSYLELQVALVLFGVGISGLVPLSVMNTRQTRSAAERFPAEQTHYLIPPQRGWAAKLGKSAVVSDDPLPTVTPSVEVVDDGDPGYAQRWESPWQISSSLEAYQGDFRSKPSQAVGHAAIWTIDGLAPGTYHVQVTYPPSAGASSDAPFHVFDGVSNLGLVRVNQRTPPAGPSYDGNQWDVLGAFTVNTGTLHVELRDDADESAVRADAIRIVPKRNSLEILSVNKSPQTNSLTVDVRVEAP